MNTALVLAGPGYRAPAIEFRGETAQREHAVWWIIVVGFAYAVALAWAAYCRHTGGDADIQFGWTGFKVVCKGR